MTALRPLRPLHLHLSRPARTLTTASTLSRSIADSAKEAVRTIDRAAGSAALKGIETGEAIAQTAKRTAARTREVGSGVAGKAKGTASEAAGKAYEGAGGMKGEVSGDARANVDKS
ncbi:unnamed protein product [Tuber aestivum]|uniref:Uncharacterized protein n=1 Tax=Tuber aestivum TaxID=59557 RepID=A0A292PXM0_9PEZI|nr:unnamed protein product [Tuber aestivum]